MQELCSLILMRLDKESTKLLQTLREHVRFFCIFHFNTDTCVLWNYKMSHLKNKFSRFLHAKLSLIRIGWTACPHFSISLWPKPNFKLWCKSIPWNWTANFVSTLWPVQAFRNSFHVYQKVNPNGWFSPHFFQTFVSPWKDWAEARDSPNPSSIRVNSWLQHGILLLWVEC